MYQVFTETGVLLYVAWFNCIVYAKSPAENYRYDIK